MTQVEDGDDSFFLELEKTAKLLSVADGRRSSTDLKTLFDDLRSSGEGGETAKTRDTFRRFPR